MVDPSLQSAIEALLLGERLELVEFVESTMGFEPIELIDEQTVTVRSRADEMEADPAIGLTWEELCSRLGSRWA